MSLLGGSNFAYAMTCKDLFSIEKNRKASNTDQLIESRVSSINSVEALARFLDEIGGIGQADQQHTVRMAGLIYHELGQSGVERIARNLLMSHRHSSQAAVLSAFIAHARGESSGPRSLENYLPKPITRETFLQWTYLGERITENAQFMSQLKLALRDFKDFEYVYGSSIRAEQAFANVVDGLRGLNSPSLVGRFVELFSQADRLTRQYIFDAVTELKHTDGQGISVVVKGTSSDTPNASAKAFEAVFEKNLSQLQEEAYFGYRSNGVLTRPQLAAVETTKTTALRFIERMKYDLTENDVKYASKILAQHPTADAAVDAAMVKLLESGLKVPAWRHKYDDVTYASHELLMLDRLARGLSHITIDFTYSAQVLANKTKYRIYLGNLVDFHSKFDLRNFPVLQQIVVTYFRKFPDSLSDLPESHYANAEKFKRDFGL